MSHDPYLRDIEERGRQEGVLSAKRDIDRLNETLQETIDGHERLRVMYDTLTDAALDLWWRYHGEHCGHDECTLDTCVAGYDVHSNMRFGPPEALARATEGSHHRLRYGVRWPIVEPTAEETAMIMGQDWISDPRTLTLQATLAAERAATMRLRQAICDLSEADFDAEPVQDEPIQWFCSVCRASFSSAEEAEAHNGIDCDLGT